MQVFSRRSGIHVVAVLVALASVYAVAQSEQRSRIIVLTDITNEPEDCQIL